MSSFQSAAWLRRLWSLAAPGPPNAQWVQNVQLVNDRGYASSRERAPYGAFWISQGAAGAGVHNYIEVGGTDAQGMPPTIIVHYARFSAPDDCRIGIAAANGISAATRVAQTLKSSDSDDSGLSPTVFAGNVATANIPAAVSIIPVDSFATVGVVDTFSGALVPIPALHSAFIVDPGSVFYMIGNTANTALRTQVVWQVMRT